MLALPPAEPPARVVSGVRITWPLAKAETVLEPGTELTVRIASKRRRAKVSFVRVNASGKALAAVGRRTLRRGSFTVTVPNATPGARYALRLTVAGRKRFSWVTTPVPAIPAPVAAPVTASPTPTPTPPSFCNGPVLPSSAFTGEVRLQSGSAQAGTTLAYTLVNTGQGMLMYSSDRQLVPDPPGQPSSIGGGNPYTPFQPGASVAQSLDISADTAPGRYRIAHSMTWGQCDYLVPLILRSEPFDVLPGD